MECQDRKREDDRNPRHEAPRDRNRDEPKKARHADHGPLLSYSIARGFIGGGSGSRSRRKHLRGVMKIGKQKDRKPCPLEDVPITFSKADYGKDTGHDGDPLIIEAVVSNQHVKRVLVDTGSSCGILFLGAYKSLQLADSDLIPYDNELIGFTGTE